MCAVQSSGYRPRSLQEQACIDVQQLGKCYTVFERSKPTNNPLSALLQRKKKLVEAVKELSFTITQGEIVGFLGANGAGKTTVLKMLAGLLYPSQGSVSVLGYRPWQRKRAFLRQIALVMGQRSTLWWDLPVNDSFELHRVLYELSYDEYRGRCTTLTDLLDLGNLLNKPARTLSLGERMKCELALSLLHQPRVLFLDEPTIGLDIVMQRRIRTFLKEYNQRFAATILLTSHLMADIEALCQRAMIIQRGSLLFDGSLKQLTQLSMNAHPHTPPSLEDALTYLFTTGDLNQKEVREEQKSW